jgi:hypothetical protein
MSLFFLAIDNGGENTWLRLEKSAHVDSGLAEDRGVLSAISPV